MMRKPANRKMEIKPATVMVTAPLTQLVLIGALLLSVIDISGLNTADAAVVQPEHVIEANTLTSRIEMTGLVTQQFAEAQNALQHEDYDQAAFILRLLAEQGHGDAQFYLGVLYGGGIGVGRDIIGAVEWYRKAAEQGHVEAQYELGLAYSTGTGVAVDTLKAVHWWRRAAVAGNTDAQFNLGLLYAQGEGVVKNMLEAARWWHQAATHGDAAAQYALGLMLARGDGVRQDLEQAIKWWYLSASQGFERAQAALNQLGGIVISQ